MEPSNNPLNSNPQEQPNQPLAEVTQPQPLPQTAPVNSPGLIVLQWLTYAFWGWTILGMSILTITLLASFIADAETGSFTPYGIATVLVLLPISIACDVFYSKKEPQRKAGAASIVMVIHAVIFALFGIGAVIAIVFALVSMLTSNSDSTYTQVSLFSSMIIALLYGAVFLRTINPARLPMVRRVFIIFMAAAVGIIALLSIVGPVARERATRNDRLISSNLGSLKSQIDNYAADNNRLPDTLKDLDLGGDSKILVDKNLVKYTANTLPASNTSTNTSINRKITSTTTAFYYQLCVTYTEESKSKYDSYSSRDRSDSDGYTTHIDSYGDHKAGEKCYKLKTSGYDY